MPSVGRALRHLFCGVSSVPHRYQLRCGLLELNGGFPDCFISVGSLDGADQLGLGSGFVDVPS